jgi:3-hydroxybutyryl-CoA dehydrogenase
MVIGVVTGPFEIQSVFPGPAEGTRLIPCSLHSALPAEQADALVDLAGNAAFQYPRNVPVLVGNTIEPFGRQWVDGQQYARFSAWPSFAERALWEIALPAGDTGHWLTPIMQALGKDYRVVADVPGLVAPRILSTIINEACYTLAAGVSTAEEIDMAMQLGTNYPKGPFAWGRQIGYSHIAELLQALASENEKYTPHPLLNQL